MAPDEPARSSVQGIIIALSTILQNRFAYCRDDQLLFKRDTQASQVTKNSCPILFGARGDTCSGSVRRRTRCRWKCRVGVVQDHDDHDEGIEQEVAEEVRKLPQETRCENVVSWCWRTSNSGAPGGFKSGGKFQKALKACSKLLPAGSQFGSGAGTPPNGSSTAFAAFRNCMTLNHVTLARGAYGTTSSSSTATPTSSSTYKKAYSKCSALLPKSPTTTG
jgi:hypothetical protein